MRTGHGRRNTGRRSAGSLSRMQMNAAALRLRRKGGMITAMQQGARTAIVEKILMNTFILLLHRRLAAVSLVFFCACAAHAAEPDFVPSAELLGAAKKEGKIVLYTAN